MQLGMSVIENDENKILCSKYLLINKKDNQKFTDERLLFEAHYHKRVAVFYFEREKINIQGEENG
jgi:hypothetical protein